MSGFAFHLPDLGEGVVEGEIVQWHIDEGGSVILDQPLLDVMTDKATVTVPSPVTGVLVRQNGQPGEVMVVGSLCAEILVNNDGGQLDLPNEAGPTLEDDSSSSEQSGQTTLSQTSTSRPAPTPTSATIPEQTSTISPKNEASERATSTTTTSPEVATSQVSREYDTPFAAAAHDSATPATIGISASLSSASSDAEVIGENGAGTRPLASPAVRRRARNEGIDLRKVRGTGPAGRINHHDLELFFETADSQPSIKTDVGNKREDVVEIPLVGLRRKISEQMTKSYTTIPHYSYFEEVDVTELEKLRQGMNANRTPEQGKLTYLPFIMRALTKLFSDGHEGCNGHFDDEREVLRLHAAVNLGIATTTDRGLFVPVVKNCEAMNIWEVGGELRRVSTAARDGSATLSELTGSTFTITSLGRDGGIGATPIINAPEVGILGIHKAIDRPMVVNGKIAIRKMMNLSSSWDHRVIDGADGAALVQGLKRLLEHPIQIL